MDPAAHNKIVSPIRGDADDFLRDLFRRGKSPDGILPMRVPWHMDAVLVPTKHAYRLLYRLMMEAIQP